MNLVDQLIDKDFGPGFELLSVMIPLDANVDTEIEVTKPDTISYGQLFQRTENGFKHDEQPQDRNNFEKGADLDALERGNVSVTPISLALTTEEGLRNARRIIEKN
jgi:broad specificity polyphosphatase/5'/3'-nucleotidase SurE